MTGSVPGQITARRWQQAELIGEIPPDQITTWLATPGALVWVDLCAPDPDQLARLAEQLGLDPLAVEDAVAGERVKLSRHQRHLLVTSFATRIESAADEGEHRSRLVTTQVSAFVLPRGLVTVRQADSFTVSAVLDRWQANSDLLRYGVLALLHGLLDEIVDGQITTIEQLDEVVEELEEQLFAPGLAHPTQQQIYRLRRELADLRRVVLPMREVVSSLLRRRLLGLLPDEEQPVEPAAALDGWLEDLYDHVLWAQERTEALRDMVSGLFETHLALQDVRLNTVMKKLAGWAAVIAVPTAVTGWFGQNVPYPGFSTASGLWQSVIVIVVATVTLYLVLRRYDWI